MFLTMTAMVVSATLKEKFEKWLNEFQIDVKMHKEVYDKTLEEMFNTWVENEKFIVGHNLHNSTYKLGHNKFSALNTNEFQKFMGFGQIHRSKTPPVYKEPNPDIKFLEAFDWREHDAVTDVKNQFNCGSCWSFSSTGALEGAYKIKTGVLKSFSEQQLVSCDNKQNGGTDFGCNGGMMDNAFEFIKKNNGLCSEEDYPYTSGTTQNNGECKTTCDVDSLSDITSYVDVKPNSDEALMEALLQGPVSIAIQANQKKFQMYKSGVLKGDDCGDDLDHGVLVVGWGVQDGVQFWVVKNSWGNTWGSDGYIFLERGTSANKGSGTCGILSCPSYPVL